MSQANELLNGLTEGDVTMFTAEPEAEGHIVIGKDRFITIPEELKRIAVQRDHNIETVTFDCPRYWDEHDLMDMDIYINYKNANNVLGAYLAQNVEIDGDDDSIIHFTWTISGAVTTHKGNIVFLVCAKVVDVATGEETLHWNSEINNDMYVSEGLEAVAAVYTGDTDLYTQLITIVESAEVLDPMGSGINSERHNGVPKENASGMNSFVQGRGTIARGSDQHARGRFNVVDTENKYADIVGNGTSDGNRSNAYTLDWDGNAKFAGGVEAASIKSTGGLEAGGKDILDELDKRVNEVETVVDDTVARIKDVPDNALPNAKLVEIGGMTRKCDNLIPFPYVGGSSKTSNGITFTVNPDGGIAITGTNTHTTYVEYPFVTTNSTKWNHSKVTVSLYGSTSDDIYITVGGGGWSFGEVKAGTSTVLTNSGTTNVFSYGLVRVKAGATVSATIYPMINPGSSALPYEPYFEDLRSAPVTEVKSVGKNFLDMERFYDVSNWENVPSTISSNYHAFSLGVLPAGTYKLSAVDTGSDLYLYVQAKQEDGSWKELASFYKGQYCFSDTRTMTLDKPTLIRLWTWDNSEINLQANLQKFINLQIERGNVETEYEPYKSASIPIPAALRNLDGYGLGAGEVSNTVDFDSGKYTRRVGAVDLGTLSWYYDDFEGKKVFSCYNIPNIKSDTRNTVCSIPFATFNDIWNNGLDNVFFVNDARIRGVFAQYTDDKIFKAAMSGVMLVYELAEPEVIDISIANSIEVTSGGTVTMVNEHRFDVPNTIEFYTSTDIKDSIGAKKIVGDLVGNASSANMAKRLSTPRTITLSGDVTGSTEFDGSDDITINTTVKNLTHTHDNATESNAGFMSAADAKYIAKVKTTDLGNFKDKTLADLQTALVDWISTRANYPNATAVFSCETIQNIWNAGDLTAIFNAGAQWTVRLETSFGGNNYTQLQFSRYFDKDIYVAALSNGVWQKMHKIAYTDDQLNLSGGTLTGGLSTSAYKTDSGLTVETTPQFRNIVITSDKNSVDLSKLAVGDLICVTSDSVTTISEGEA